MLAAHQFGAELRLMCLLIACAVIIGVLSGAAAGERDRDAARQGLERSLAAQR